MAKSKSILLVASGDLRQSANEVCWPAQHAMEQALTAAVVRLGHTLTRAHPYKPAQKHWEVFREQTGAEDDRHVHVAQSLFHDISTAKELGLPSVWINRLGERHDTKPTRELPDLAELPEVLDELVPA